MLFNFAGIVLEWVNVIKGDNRDYRYKYDFNKFPLKGLPHKGCRKEKCVIYLS